MKLKKRYTEVKSATLEDPGERKMEGSGWEGQNCALRRRRRRRRVAVMKTECT